MQPRNNRSILLVDSLVIGLLIAGYYYGNDLFVTPVLIFMTFILLAASSLFLMYFIPVITHAAGLAKLKAMDKFWTRLDDQSTSEYIYDEITDVAVVVLLWLVSAPVFSVLWAVVVAFKGYNRTKGARQRVINQVRKYQASKDA